MRYPAVIALLLVIVAASVGGYRMLRGRSVPPTQYASALAYWEHRVASEGGDVAYREFAASVASMDASEQHGLAHAFGGALYNAAGLPGIVACDARFSYGCYHQFIGAAIADQGLSVIDGINDVCKTLRGPSPCQHGIGHGLVGYLGYQPADLKKAIAECAGVDDGTSLQGCDGGAFMEYNIRTLAGPDAERTPSNDPDEPCDSFSGAAALSCYLYQPQWWWTSTFASSTSTMGERFATMGSRCFALAGDARSTCMRGVGLMVPPNAAYVAAASRDLCDSAATNDDDRLNCIEGAVVVFAGVERDTEAKELCGLLAGSEKDACMQYSDGRKNL